MSDRSDWHRAESARRLRDAYGDEIELFDEQEESVVHRILAEFRHEGALYAVLQSKQLKKEKEVAIFKVTESGDGELTLETIEDDDEWETVSELYDEMSFPIQDRP
ncbi:DUF1292 domain-containing protein [Paenibacillus hodogayensis]|uniref:DUF1292 domain-containing protein n=1 Tax=Paenibacillus hodogayensis TaxID=279208 RepID=A0ABV5VVG1_9BACL